MKSEPRRDAHYLDDILEAVRHVLEYTLDLTYDEYLRSSLIQDAVLRNFQVIGEATKKLSTTLQAEYPRMPWRTMAGMRDKVVHDYFGIDHRVVWDVVRTDLPPLLTQLEVIIQDKTEDETS